MSQGRSPKRARQKDRRAAQREVMRSMYLRRRRQRRIALALVSVVLIGGGSAIALTAFRKPSAPTPSATPQVPGVVAPTPGPVACGAKLPPTAGQRKEVYGAPTDQHLDPNKRYIVELKTSCGTIDIALAVSTSPKTANSIAFLVRKHFYDGLVFHRISPDFVIQGGDPKGDGSGTAGYQVIEPPPKNFQYSKGTVAMAKAGSDPPGASSSQFFVVATEHGQQVLTPDYAVAGLVSKGMDAVAKIMQLATGDTTPPKAYAYIESADLILQLK